MSLSLSFVGSSRITASQASYSHSVNYGAAASDRWLYICIHHFSGVLIGISSVTVDGNAASYVADARPQVNVGAYLYKYLATSGSSGTIVVNYASSTAGSQITVYRVTGIDAEVTPVTDVTLSSNALSASIAIPANGAFIAFGSSLTTGTFATSWTTTGAGITEDYDNAGNSSGNGFSSASYSGLAAETPTITATFPATASFAGLVVVAFRPKIEGQANITLGALTCSAAGAVALKGAAAITLAALTASAAGVVSLKAQASITLGDVVMVATGSTTLTGAVDVTLGSLTVSATGSLEAEPSTGAVSVTLDPLTLTGTATVKITGQASIVLGTLTASGVGDLADEVVFWPYPLYRRKRR